MSDEDPGDDLPIERRDEVERLTNVATFLAEHLPLNVKSIGVIYTPEHAYSERWEVWVDQSGVPAAEAAVRVGHGVKVEDALRTSFGGLVDRMLE